MSEDSEVPRNAYGEKAKLDLLVHGDTEQVKGAYYVSLRKLDIEKISRGRPSFILELRVTSTAYQCDLIAGASLMINPRNT